MNLLQIGLGTLCCSFIYALECLEASHAGDLSHFGNGLHHQRYQTSETETIDDRNENKKSIMLYLCLITNKCYFHEPHVFPIFNRSYILFLNDCLILFGFYSNFCGEPNIGFYFLKYWSITGCPLSASPPLSLTSPTTLNSILLSSFFFDLNGLKLCPNLLGSFF